MWTEGDLDDESNRRMQETTQGEVIASGDTDAGGYGSTPLERGLFIVDAIRAHLRRAVCTVHSAEREAVEERLGRPMAWCPVCGTRTALPL